MNTPSLFFITLLIIVQGFSSCKKIDTEVSNKEPVVFTKSQEAILKNSNESGFNLLRVLTENNSKNLFISPLSISMAMTMAYNGAVENTAAEMKKALGFQDMDKNEINQSFKDLMQIILNIDPKVTIEIANSIWYKNSFSVKKDFLDLNANYFNAEVRSTDYSPQTVSLINDWVETKTHGKIDKIIDALDPQEVMDIINAIYFKGTWKYKFELGNTQKEDFHQTDGSIIRVDFMAMKNTFRYMKNEILSAIELPYGSGGINMLVLLPNQGKTTGDIISALTPQNWDAWTGKMDSLNIDLRIPKFKFSYESSLKYSLQQLGMNSAFSEQLANFSEISDDKLWISDVIHKTFVDVNEEGTEAAAVTAVRIIATSIGEPEYIPFFANKPFVFAIRENTTNSVIFIGVVNSPVID